MIIYPISQRILTLLYILNREISEILHENMLNFSFFPIIFAFSSKLHKKRVCKNEHLTILCWDMPLACKERKSLLINHYMLNFLHLQIKQAARQI